MNEAESSQDFLSDPVIIENYSILQETGIFRYIDRLKREIRKYKNLLAGAGDIFNRTNIDEIMDTAVWHISDQFLPSFVIFIWKPHQNRNDITIKCYKNYKIVDFSLDINTIAPLEPFFQRHREPLTYSRLAEKLSTGDAETAAVITALGNPGPELVIPVLGPSKLYGLILIGPKLLADTYTAPEQDFLWQLMSFVSQAIQNHIHYEHSVRDAKTGLFNYGFFFTRLNETISQSKRSGNPSSLIVIDVDKFKNFNDSFGHIAGDRALESIALVIKQSVRTGDVPSRFGGEEFTILLPNTGQEAAWIVAERVRLAIAGIRVPWDPPLPRVTVSLGLVAFGRDTELAADEILKRADEALYRSKKNGRNRSSIWGSPDPSPEIKEQPENGISQV
ncbi:MAG: GGDEF domain-containing protein [Spirochaetaceae bacterium]|jgi:diguanylate cyclase (GGDEF)-like protein|nr:GGDEF domain-containing protein [Spirochaetaceae bacterium]